MKGFNHPNIVQCYDYHLSEKHGLFMVLQLCTGGQLRGVKRDESNSIPLFLQITNAIKYLHSKNVWHRDLKPENIFLDEQGNIKVGDLGIAKVMQNTDATSALYYYGSTPYISPQILERDSYSAKADVWSLGCIFHEVLSGEIAFKSKELTKQIHYTELGHKFSFGIRELIKDMLLKKESDRPSSDDVFARLELIQGKKYVQPPSPKKTELAVDWPKLVTAILIAEGKNANIIR
uniref:non-specific serine/threonine protein kinase n=1 Tax=Biomphalaria glabrata TaxID=6526 RepID=A0A2C9LVD8_BIOGL